MDQRPKDVSVVHPEQLSDIFRSPSFPIFLPFHMNWYYNLTFCILAHMIMETLSERAVAPSSADKPQQQQQVPHKCHTSLLQLDSPLLWQAQSPLKPYRHACTHSSWGVCQKTCNRYCQKEQNKNKGLHMVLLKFCLKTSACDSACKGNCRSAELLVYIGSRALYPCSTKTREVLGNPSPTVERFPETREISRGEFWGDGFPNTSLVLVEHGYNGN